MTLDQVFLSEFETGDCFLYLVFNLLVNKLEAMSGDNLHVFTHGLRMTAAIFLERLK